MQSRNGNSQSRLVLIGCLALLLITGVLYFMKRMEASRLNVELSGIKSEKKEREEDLNTRLTDYLHKMEEMTKQLGDLQSKLKNCEDAKAGQVVEAEAAKQAVRECHSQQAEHIQKQGDIEEEFQKLQEECSNAQQSHLKQAAHLQQTQQEAEEELDSCKAQALNCQNSLARAQAETVQVKANCEQQLQQRQGNFQAPLPAESVNVFNKNPGLPSNPNQGVAYRPKPYNMRLPGQQQQVPNIPGQQEVTEEEHKEPHYPEEDDKDEDKPTELDEKELFEEGDEEGDEDNGENQEDEPDGDDGDW